MLRQDDSDHSPQNFMKRHSDVGVIIDLTSQDPPYDTANEVHGFSMCGNVGILAYICVH